MATLLTLDAALGGGAAGVVRDGVVLAEAVQAGGRGSSSALPVLAHQALQAAGVAMGALDGIAVTVGPGSFTGIRGALALAHGMAFGAGIPVWGVTVGAALRAGLASAGPVWVAIDSRRGQIFLDDGTQVFSVALDGLPAPPGPVGLAGDAAAAAAGHLAARGFDVQLLATGPPGAAGIAAAARTSALPLYVDPVAARPGPAGRPAPT